MVSERLTKKKSSENRFKLETRYQNEQRLNNPFKHHHENRFIGDLEWEAEDKTCLGFTDTAVHPKMKRSEICISSPHWALTAMTTTSTEGIGPHSYLYKPFNISGYITTANASEETKAALIEGIL